jgi:hypothetical protein
MPGRSIPKRCSLLLACALAGGAGSAAAQTPAAAPALEYEAPGACPSRSLWTQRVLARLRADAGEWSAERLNGVAARVAVDATGTEARVVFHGGGVERSLRGADCDEVTSAAALILAIALGASPAADGAKDPAATPTPPDAGEPAPSHAALAPAAPTSAPPRVAPPVSARPRVAPRRARATQPSRVAASRAVLMRRAEPRALEAPPDARGAAASPGAASEVDQRALDSTTDAPGFSPALGGSAELNGWTGPWPTPLIGISADVVSPSRGWSARLTAVHGTSEVNVSARRAELSYWGGHLDLCPLVFGGAGAWRWSSCVELHLGVLSGSGDERSALRSGLTQRALLATGAGSTRLETPPLWAVRLGLELGVAVPVLRQAFQFGSPAETVFESPLLGVFGRVGIRVPFEGERD